MVFESDNSLQEIVFHFCPVKSFSFDLQKMHSTVIEISKDVLFVMFDVLDMAFEEDLITIDVMYIQIKDDSNSNLASNNEYVNDVKKTPTYFKLRINSQWA